MLTTGVAKVGTGQGTPLLLPSSSTEQGKPADGLFAKNLGELIAGSADTKTQPGGEQMSAGAEKNDASGTKELSEGRLENPGCESSLPAQSPSTAVTSMPVTFIAEGMGQPANEMSVATQVQSDIENPVAKQVPAKGLEEQNVNLVAAEPRPSLIIGSNQSIAMSLAAASNVGNIPKQASVEGKLQETVEHKVSTQKESKKQAGAMQAAEVTTPVDGLGLTGFQQAVAPATSSPMSVEIPVAQETGTDVVPTKSSLGSAGRVNKLTNGTVVSVGRDQVQRGRETDASAGGGIAVGLHGAAGHSEVLQASKESMVPSAVTGSGEVGVKTQETDAASAGVAARNIGIDGSAHGAMQHVASAAKGEGVLTANAVSAAVIQSQGVPRGDPLTENDGQRMIAATPTSLEVGFANGSHGWLKIRAELGDGGAVNASLSAASSAGQEMLHRELPSLTAYLQSEQLNVNTVVHAVAASETRDFSGASGSDQQSQKQQGSGDRSGDAREGLAVPDGDRTDEASAFAGHEGAAADALSSAVYRDVGLGGGGWLSVMA